MRRSLRARRSPDRHRSRIFATRHLSIVHQSVPYGFGSSVRSGDGGRRPRGIVQILRLSRGGDRLSLGDVHRQHRRVHSGIVPPVPVRARWHREGLRIIGVLRRLHDHVHILHRHGRALVERIVCAGRRQHNPQLRGMRRRSDCRKMGRAAPIAP